MRYGCTGCTYKQVVPRKVNRYWRNWSLFQFFHFLGTRDGYNWYNSGGTECTLPYPEDVPWNVYLPYPEKCTDRTSNKYRSHPMEAPLACLSWQILQFITLKEKWSFFVRRRHHHVYARLSLSRAMRPLRSIEGWYLVRAFRLASESLSAFASRCSIVRDWCPVKAPQEPLSVFRNCDCLRIWQQSCDISA